MLRVGRSASLAGVVSLVAAAVSLFGAASPWLRPILSGPCHPLLPIGPLTSISGVELLHSEGLGVRFRLAAWLLVAGITLLLLVGLATVARRHLTQPSIVLGASVSGSLLVGAAVLLATPPPSRGLCLSYSLGQGQTICACAALVGLVGSVLLARTIQFDRTPNRQGDVVGAQNKDELTSC